MVPAQAGGARRRDRAVLAAGVHRLEDHQEGALVLRVELLLELAEVGPVAGELGVSAISLERWSRRSAERETSFRAIELVGEPMRRASAVVVVVHTVVEPVKTEQTDKPEGMAVVVELVGMAVE